MEDGRMKQIGITSFGLALGCELGLHAAFTRTSKYLLRKYFQHELHHAFFWQLRIWNLLKRILES